MCPKCGLERPLTKHHIYPARFFGRGGETILFCRECHDTLEKLIPFERQSDSFYPKILEVFLKGGEDVLDAMQGVRNRSPRRRTMYRQLFRLWNRKQNTCWIPSSYRC